MHVLPFPVCCWCSPVCGESFARVWWIIRPCVVEHSPVCGRAFAVVHIRPMWLHSGLSFSQRATKQPISHRGSWGAQTGPGTFRRQLISIIMNYNQPWTTLGLAPQPQRENRDPNGSQGSANFHCIMVPGSPWSALRSLLRLQSAILTSTSDARDFVGGPEHR